MISNTFLLSSSTLWLTIFFITFLLSLTLWWLLKSKNVFTIIKIKNQTRKNKKRNFIKIEEIPQKTDQNLRSIKTILLENKTHDQAVFSSALFLKMHSFLLHCTSKNDFIKNSIKNFCYFCPGQTAILYWDENDSEILQKKVHFSIKKPEKKELSSIAYEKNIMLRYGKESDLLKKKSHYVMSMEKNTYLCLPLFIFKNNEKKAKIAGILKLSLQKDEKGEKSEKKDFSAAEIKKLAHFFTRIAFFYAQMLSHYSLFNKNILHSSFFSVDYFTHLVKTLQKINDEIKKNTLSWELTGVQLCIKHSQNQEIPLSLIKIFGEKMEQDENISFRFCLFSQEKDNVVLLALLRQNKKSSFTFSHTQEKINQNLIDANIHEHPQLSKTIEFIDFEKLAQIVLK